jgi:hypothetical protein
VKKSGHDDYQDTDAGKCRVYRNGANDVPGHQEFQAKQDRAAEQPAVLFVHLSAALHETGGGNDRGPSHSDNHHCNAGRLDGFADELNGLLELH